MRFRWTELAAWVVIVLVAVGVPLAPVLRDLSARSGTPTGRPGTGDAPKASGDQDDTVTLPVVMQGRYLVGMQHVLVGLQGGAGADSKKQVKEMLKALDGAAKSRADRIAAAVLAGEVNGKEQAIERLEEIGDDDADAFADLYVRGTPLPAEVAGRYGFFADLARAEGKGPGDTFRDRAASAGVRTAATLFTLGAVACGALVVGLGLLIVALVRIAGGKTRARVTRPLGPKHAYLEAFALYILILMFGPLGAEWGLRKLGADPGPAVAALGILLATAVGLGWPLLRGASLARMRPDWGLHTGKGPFTEMGAGLIGYLAGLPLMAVAFLVFFLLSRFAPGDGQPGHPIQEMVKDHALLVFVLAVIAAPLTEELMFRGAFLSNLRGTFGAVLSGVISSLVFAALHPQGWTAIPLLATIGFNLAMIRQWRGSLIPSITAHAINNGTIVLMLLVATA